MPISKPHSTLGASNTSSCSDLAMYLEKENKELDRLLKKVNSIEEKRDIENRKQFFFSHSENNISTIDVIYTIDKNKKKLSKKDTKFFAPTISFSQQELQHILKSVTEKTVADIWELDQKEYEQFNLMIKEFARIIMTNYAKNFNRQNKGLKSGNDLVYFAKIEHFRKYKGTDKEVIKGVKKTGEYKPGLNSHCHVIVSRKDKTQKMKLDPTVKERSTTRTIGGNTYHVGFDRMKWINMNEHSFDTFFKYNRPELEKFNNQYILKNGSPKEKQELLNRIKPKEKLLSPVKNKTKVNHSNSAITNSQNNKPKNNAQNNSHNITKRRNRKKYPNL